MASLRSLNQLGVGYFRRYLSDLRVNSQEKFPDDLLFGNDYSVVVDPTIELESKSFKTKLEAAEYLHPKIKAIQGDIFHDLGIWSWLSAFYFDSVCPPGQDGERKPGADYRHILISGRDWRHSYRHLLAGPVRTFDFHGPGGALLLSGPVNKLGDFVEQLCSRQDIASNKGVIEAVTILYWDEKRQNPKRGSAPTERRPGTLRRFVDVIQQLELTYDLYSMNGTEIAALLPIEFAAWL